MRVVVAKEPLASADPDTVCALVAGALGNLLENLPKDGSADGGSAGNPE